jgi:hypothetical protein
MSAPVGVKLQPAVLASEFTSIQRDDMKNRILFVTIFALGVGLGVFAHWSLASQPSPQRADVIEADVKQWDETEEKTRTRMSVFQSRLDNLAAQPTPDSVERIGAEMEAQRGIDDILIKYREAQQAKFAPFQTLAGAVGGWIITLMTQWLGRRKSNSSDPSGRLPS